MYKPAKTQRGFTCAKFDDFYGAKCSIQESSIGTVNAIWFGVRLGFQPADDYGWQKYNVPSEVSLTTRMHLTQEQVRSLLPVLAHFAETGKLPDTGD